MRLLLIHSDYIEYEAKKKTKMAEECSVLSDREEEALTVFCAVESIDEEDLEGVVLQGIEEIKKTAGQVNVNKILIYPYAHLSSDLSSPETAITVLNALKAGLETEGFAVKRAPFGWYKSFKLSVQGPPALRASKTIVPGGEEGTVKPAKKEVTHDWFVLTPDGKKHDYKEYLDDSPFGCLVKKELGVAVPVGGEPAHVDLMRSKELVDYEPASDVGCLRWMPKGKLIRDLLADYVLRLVLEYGGTPVETPVMYDLGDKAICEHAAKFGERQYRFKSNNRDMMLRFAACFGMFSIMRDMHISPNNLPMKMYEFSTYSFRHEQKGEVIGLKRLRAFTMPDMHSLCLDMPQALKCFEEQSAMGWQTGKDFETELVAAFRCTKDFYAGARGMGQEDREGLQLPDAHRDPLRPGPLLGGQDRPRRHRRPAPPDREPDRPDRCRVLDPVRHQVPQGRRHSRLPADPPLLPHGQCRAGHVRHPREHLHADGPRPPDLALARTGPGRPGNGEAHRVCAGLAKTINAARIRCDIDDRNETMGKKVREAGMDWVPYVVVVGDEEVASRN